jgi:two-component system nitrogen regulation response regulator GlnG
MSTSERVWIVDDDQSIRWVLCRALEAVGMQVRAFEAAESLLECLRGDCPDAIVTDLRMPGLSGVSLLEKIGALEPQLLVIIMTAYADLDSAVSAYRAGAFEYLPKPFDVDEAVSLVRSAIKNHAPTAVKVAPSSVAGPEILGSVPALQEVFRAIGKLSRSHITVLITGETGTGKELVARALHEKGPRRADPFIALNTAAIPAELLESELFGHERGAFTGAQAKRRGRFE